MHTIHNVNIYNKQQQTTTQDAVVQTGVFHLQSTEYETIKPPTYYDYPNLNRRNLTRNRNDDIIPYHHPIVDKYESDTIRRRARVEQSIEYVDSEIKRDKAKRAALKSQSFRSVIDQHAGEGGGGGGGGPRRLEGRGRLDGGWGGLYGDGTSTHYPVRENVNGDYDDYDDDDLSDDDTTVYRSETPVGFESTRGGRTHSLFLQELAHLASLTVAVAFSTLRNDVPGTESPLVPYRPGEPWPEADPDNLPSDVKVYMYSGPWPVRMMRFWFGLMRTEESKVRHAGARPLPVIGGVSAGEIEFLQRARGSSAKVTLAWNWLSEFVIREHLAGSLGPVGPPIVSRIIQFLSDGMTFYNHSRKIMYHPFPFPSAQLSAFFVLVMVPTIPLLMGQYINAPWLGAVFTFLTVTCLIGLHEVARELENVSF